MGMTQIVDIAAVASKVKIRWPALMFAISRSDNVNGRIKYLISSIKARNGARYIGAPLGIREARASLKFFTYIESVNDVNIVKVISNNTKNCVVTPKYNGNKPNRFKKIIITNKEFASILSKNGDEESPINPSFLSGTIL